MLKDMTIEAFLAETASDLPAPGGGSISALSGALGAALAAMVGRLSMGKDAGGDMINKMSSHVDKCTYLMNSLKEGIDKDTDSFNAVMAAFKMPKNTDEEKQSRSKHIQNAFKYAAEVPYQNAALSFDVMQMAYDALREGNKNAASDAAVAGLLSYAALNGALYNVKINLNSIKDNEYVQSMKEKSEDLAIKGEELLNNIKNLSQEVIG